MPQTDGRRTNFDFMSSADIVKQSQKQSYLELHQDELWKIDTKVRN